jgi:hypothetical protein
MDADFCVSRFCLPGSDQIGFVPRNRGIGASVCKSTLDFFGQNGETPKNWTNCGLFVPGAVLRRHKGKCGIYPYWRKPESCVDRGFEMELFHKAFALAVFVSLGLVSVTAQTTSQSGAITGIVTDPSGAAVANAKVTLDSPAGLTQTQTSGASGEFTFPLLQPGTYKVTVSAQGFNVATLNDIKVEVAQATRLPVALQLGSTTVEVNISEQITLINPTSATLGNTLPGAMVENLPLATRNFTNLLALNAGASSALPNAAAAGRGSATVFVNGQRGTANNLVINGIDANNLGSNNFSTVPIPAPDTIEEFRVQTSLYDASQGKTSGGNVNVLTKGGGPEYHGELYEFFRNDDLNANSFFFNRSGTPRAELRQNQFGGNFGGPVPKVSKTFFFGSYEGTRQINGLSGAIIGRFPVLPAQRTRANIEQAFGLAPGTLDPVALNILNAKGVYNGLLVPSGTGAAPGVTGNIAIADPQVFHDNQFNTNGDHLFSDRHRISLRYFHAKGNIVDALGGQGAGSLGSGLKVPNENQIASISDTYTFTSNLTNEARFGFTRNLSANIPNEPVSLSDVGMTRFNSSFFSGIPYIVTNDPIPNFGGISTNFDQQAAANTFHFADTVAWVHGRHSIRGGVEYRRYQINTFNNFASRGFITFASFKDFLTGGPIAQTFVGTGITYRDFRARDVSWYVQDDYKLTPRLIVNLGLRYDYLGPSVDRLNRDGNFDPTRLDSNTLANGGPGLAAGFILPAGFKSAAIQGTPGVDRSTLTNLNKTNFSPRISFAWDPFGDGKTAVRGGYGIYFIRIANQTQLQLLTAAPFFQQSSLVNPGTSFSNPFPNLPVPSQFPLLPVLPQFNGYSAAGAPQFSAPLLSLNPIQTNLATPYAEHFNFSIQRELPGHLILEVGYLGSQGVRLLNGLQVNAALLANANGPIRDLTTNSVTNANARVTVGGFSTAGLNMVTNAGHSNYNALDVTLNRRIQKMFLQAAYTFSKSIDNNSGSTGISSITPVPANPQDLGTQVGNPLVPRLGRSFSDFDRTHRLQITYAYDLPGFGRGLTRAVLGDWSIGGLTTFQSAPPIPFSCSTCTSTNVFGITSAASLSPDIVGDFSKLSKGGDPRNYLDSGTSMFNSGILAVPTVYTNGQVLATNLNPIGGPGNQTYTVGSNGTGTFRGQLFGSLPRNPGIRGQFQQQWDFYFAKSIPVREKMSFQLRAEFFNLFNHPLFIGASGVVGSSSFGQVVSAANFPRIVQLAGKFQF